MQIQDEAKEWIDHRFKGIPGGTAPFRLGDISLKQWNVLREDLPLPLAVIRQSSIRHNSRWMRQFLEKSGARICPHGKTTMSPALFHQQMEDGAWGLTLATVNQVQVARNFGFRRILLANQLVGRQAIRYILDEMAADPEFDFYCLVDSLEGVALLRSAAEARKAGRPLQLLLEGGFQGGRTGCRTLPQALAVARAVKDAEPWLELRGVEGFEGTISHAYPQGTLAAIREFLEFLIEMAMACKQEGLFASGRVLLTAGGSAFYDLVTERFPRAGSPDDFSVLTRSGCYLTHDSRQYAEHYARLLERSPEAAALGPGLEPALEIWSYIQSRPEQGRAILTLGKRDCSYDAGLPIPLKWHRPSAESGPVPFGPGFSITALNDQHAYLQLPEDCGLRVGDMVAVGISHPCTTFDKWRLLMVVDDSYDVISAIKTYF